MDEFASDVAQVTQEVVRELRGSRLFYANASELRKALGPVDD